MKAAPNIILCGGFGLLMLDAVAQQFIGVTTCYFY
jgi:hypothetical protein